tara:strand:- start:10002 stop:10190 length:189 start_codon:yes stop_codon:yes gene_type:complete
MEDSGSPDLGSNPRGTTLVQHLKTAVPHIETALSEIKNGSAKTAEIILQALKDILQWLSYVG